ncbi:hypothetical protein [Methylobacterium sp. Leaf125]|nr:hypothetical protein [Methylobacterium sp. Leaf125]
MAADDAQGPETSGLDGAVGLEGVARIGTAADLRMGEVGAEFRSR